MICVENQMSREICGVFQYLLQLRKTEITQLNTQVWTQFMQLLKM